MKGKVQKEKESRNQSEDNKVSLSGFMLATDSTMSGINDPDNIGSDQSNEEAFAMLSLSPQFVPRHFEDLEDALRCADNPPSSQTGDSENNSIEDSDADSPEVSSKYKHDSSSDHSDNQSHDAANDVYRTGYDKFQEEEMPTGDIHLHNMKTESELCYTKDTERSGKASEVKELKEEEEHEECEVRSQQKDQKASPSGFALGDGATMSASGDPERNGSEGNSNEELIPFSLSLPFDQRRFGDMFCSPQFKDMQDIFMLPISLTDLEQ